MKLIESLFKKYTLVEPSLVKYGFNKKEDSYTYSKHIHNNEFVLNIIIDHRVVASDMSVTVSLKNVYIDQITRFKKVH